MGITCRKFIGKDKSIMAKMERELEVERRNLKRESDKKDKKEKK